MTDQYTPDAFFAWAESRGFRKCAIEYDTRMEPFLWVVSVGYPKPSTLDYSTIGKTPAEAIQKLMEMKHE